METVLMMPSRSETSGADLKHTVVKSLKAHINKFVSLLMKSNIKDTYKKQTETYT